MPHLENRVESYLKLKHSPHSASMKCKYYSCIATYFVLKKLIRVVQGDQYWSYILFMAFMTIICMKKNNAVYLDISFQNRWKYKTVLQYFHEDYLIWDPDFFM